jgi:hypothetical protein
MHVWSLGIIFKTYSLNSNDWKFNLFIRKNNFFGIVFTDQTFSIENQFYGQLKEKSTLKEWLFYQISIDFRYKEAYSWPAIAAHAKFEHYDSFRILDIHNDRNDSQSSLSTDILSIELHTETVFFTLNSIY